MMRHRLKIKASILIMAWMVVFLHDVIPHNHSDEDAVCHGKKSDIRYSAVKKIHNHNFSLPFTHHKEGECHFTANLFAKHSLDFSDALPADNSLEIPAPNKSTIAGNDFSREYFSLSIKGYSLRGPPDIC